MEDKIQEIIGLVDDIIGCDSAGYQFECKRQIQSKLREMLVREPLSNYIIDNQYSEDYSFDGECAAFRAGARFAERTHNIINTTKE